MRDIMSLKEHIQNHPVILLFGIAVGAFSMGMGAYQSILTISHSKVVSTDARIVTDHKQVVIADSELETLKASREEATRLLARERELGEQRAREAAAAKASREASQSQLKRLSQQHDFVTRYLRYETSRRRVAEAPDDAQARSTHALAERMFVELVRRWWKKQEELDGSIQLREVQVIRKGSDPTDSRVQFTDGTVWPIPAEIKAKVLEE